MIWNYLQHFNRNEPWGDPDKICGHLLLTLEKIREVIGLRMVIHYGTQGVHTENSYHYKGMAADWHFITSESFQDQANRLILVLDKLQLADFVGFGIYPQWTTKGFHLDVRGFRARWGHLNGEYVGWEVILNSIK